MEEDKARVKLDAQIKRAQAIVAKEVAVQKQAEEVLTRLQDGLRRFIASPAGQNGSTKRMFADNIRAFIQAKKKAKTELEKIEDQVKKAKESLEKLKKEQSSSIKKVDSVKGDKEPSGTDDADTSDDYKGIDAFMP